MNDIEDRLRGAFRADAESIRPSLVRDFDLKASQNRGHRRARAASPTAFRPIRDSKRGRLLTPLAAAAAAALVIAGTFVVLPRVLPGQGASHDRRPAGAPLRFPAGPPPRFIAATTTAGLEVISSASGAVVGRLKPPKPRETFTAVATLGSDRTFIVSATFPSKCVTLLYQFSLSASGRPSGLAPFVVPELAGYLTAGPGGFLDLAGSANGRYVAFSTVRCSGFNGHVGLIDVSTASVKLWTFGGGNVGPVGLSLSADGSLLDLVSFLHPDRGHGRIQIDTTWALRTSSPAGPLTRYYRRVYGSWKRSTYAAELSPNGAVTFAATIDADVAPRLVKVTSIRTSSGEQFGRSYLFTRERNVRAVAISLSLSGRYLLVYGWTNLNKAPATEFPAVVIDLATGREKVIHATTGYPTTALTLGAAAW